MALAQTVPEQTVAAEEVPKVTLELITGTKEGVARPAGVLTKDDLINLKRYVKKGLSLPSPIGNVEEYIGYKKSNISGLEPSDFKDLFDQIRAHCLCWDGVERQVIGQSIELQSSASKIVTTGDALIDAIENKWPLGRQLMKLEKARSENLEGIKFNGEDTEVAQSLGEYLDLLKSEIEAQEKKTQVVYDSLHDFRVVLSGGKLVNRASTPGLKPQVDQKIELMEENDLLQKIAADEKAIDDKEKRIEELRKDYDKYVELSFKGKYGGPVGLLVSGGIFGPKAEKARKEKNQLIAEVRDLRAKVNDEKKLQKALFDLQSDFSGLGQRMQDAGLALGHLQFMWQSMLVLITASKDQWKLVDNGKSLMLFLVVFKTIINPWREVGDLAGILVEIMDKASVEIES